MGQQTKIRRLTEVVINQINAGEVVERPANVVKELIENSLDAGATQIEISLVEGGLQEIFVKDNGSGIPAEELTLAIERHATSKLVGLQDLASVASFGFRGEALASIASVSHLLLKSSTDSSQGGAEIEVDFGVASQPVPAASSRGTSLWVKDLFKRVPARKKFLRSSQTELAYCTRVVKEAALAHPDTAFYLYHQGTLLHSYPQNDPRARFWSCFKPQWEPLEIYEEQLEAHLQAFLSPPKFSKQRSELYFFINGRPIRNRTLLAAVRNAYLETLGKGYEPTGAVFLSIPFDRVDVNAHPQKLEVRCLQQEQLYPWIFQILSKRLREEQVATFESAKSELSELPSGKCLARLFDRYLIYADTEGLSLIDASLHTKDGRKGLYRLGLQEIEKLFNP